VHWIDIRQNSLCIGGSSNPDPFNRDHATDGCVGLMTGTILNPDFSGTSTLHADINRWKNNIGIPITNTVYQNILFPMLYWNNNNNYIPFVVEDLTSATYAACVIPPPNPNPTMKSQYPLATCPTCAVVNTLSFANTQTHLAVRTSLQQMDSTITDGYKKAVGLFNEVLTYPISTLSKEDKFVLDVAYRNMVQSLATARQRGQILPCTNNSPIGTEATKVIQVIDLLINKAQLKGDTLAKTYYSIDKALTYRIMARHDLTIQTLDDILTWAPARVLDYVAGLRCTVYNESLVANGSLSVVDFSIAIQNCPKPTKRMQVPLHSTEAPNENEIESHGALTAYPNPASKQITFAVDGFDGPYELSIFDLTGKQVYRKILTNKVEVLNAEEIGLSGGIYYYRAMSKGNQIAANKLIILNFGE
jgi:hypothetical protein